VGGGGRRFRNLAGSSFGWAGTFAEFGFLEAAPATVRSLYLVSEGLGSSGCPRDIIRWLQKGRVHELRLPNQLCMLAGSIVILCGLVGGTESNPSQGTSGMHIPLVTVELLITAIQSFSFIEAMLLLLGLN